MKGGLLYKGKKKPVEARSPSRKGNIPPESKKRKIEHKRYLEQIKEFWVESVTNKTNFCHFCGAFSETILTIHHLKGRTGDFYLDKEWFWWSHNECHLMYHHLSVDILEKQIWYQDFLNRLKLKDINLWERQTEKKLKNINPKLFEEFDD